MQSEPLHGFCSDRASREHVLKRLPFSLPPSLCVELVSLNDASGWHASTAFLYGCMPEGSMQAGFLSHLEGKRMSLSCSLDCSARHLAKRAASCHNIGCVYNCMVSESNFYLVAQLGKHGRIMCRWANVRLGQQGVQWMGGSHPFTLVCPQPFSTLSQSNPASSASH